MKARQMLNWFAGFVLALALASPGYAQEPGKPLSPSGTVLPKAVPDPGLSAPGLPVPQPNAGALAGVVPEKRSPGRLQVSAWLAEVVKLAQAGIDESVMLSYVESAGTFNIGADQLIYLRDLNVPNSVIQAMLQHDFELASGFRQVTASTVPSSQPFFQFSPAPGTNTQTSPRSQAETEFVVTGPMEADNWANESLLVPPVEMPRHCSATVARGKGTASPVREPYAVQLTDPILVYRTEGRVPNLLLIQGLP